MLKNRASLNNIERPGTKVLSFEETIKLAGRNVFIPKSNKRPTIRSAIKTKHKIVASSNVESDSIVPPALKTLKTPLPSIGDCISWTELYDEQVKEVKRVKDALKNYEHEINCLQSKLTTSENICQKKEAKILDLQVKLTTSESNCQRQQNEIGSLQAMLKASNDLSERHQAEIETLQAMLTAANSKLEVANDLSKKRKLKSRI